MEGSTPPGGQGFAFPIEFSSDGGVRRCRAAQGITQKQLAARLKSSQSRVAKIEAGAADVSLDLLFKALFATGGDVADLFAEARKRKRARKAQTASADAGTSNRPARQRRRSAGGTRKPRHGLPTGRRPPCRPSQPARNGRARQTPLASIE
jgi:transcriptional regulator with XRE-family HTH domain